MESLPLLILASISLVAQAGFTIQIGLLDFIVVDNKDYNGKCCDLGSWGRCSESGSSCDLSFSICLEPLPSATTDLTKCSTGWIKTGKIAENLNEIHFANAKYGEWPNPNNLHYSSTWQGLRMKMHVQDVDRYNADDEVDHFYFDFQPSLWIPGTLWRYNGKHYRPKSSATIVNFQAIISCDSGSLGDDCHAPPDHCAGNACGTPAGFSTCSSDSLSFTCTCRRPFYWSAGGGRPCLGYCEHSIFSPCVNGGTCQDSTTDARGYSCACPPNYTGSNCHIRLGYCDSHPNPCQNGGSCVDGGGDTFVCSCPHEYGGDRCEIHMGFCDIHGNPCINGGTCMDTNTTAYVCQCPPNYFGQVCQTEKGFCQTHPNPCLHGGTCDDGGNPSKFICHCPTAYSGERCETALTACQLHPHACLNGGRCEDGGNTTAYSCSCTPDYEGANCSALKPFCIRHAGVCRNGGTCVDGASSGDYSCQCHPSFTGVNCTTPRPFCQWNPNVCHNGGTCLDGGSQTVYTCHCSEAFTGDHCDTPLTYCQRHPHLCLNGGSCVDGGNLTSFTCHCSQAFQGLYCQTSKTYCQRHPSICLNGGSCVDGGSHQSYFCQCPPQWTGKDCQLRKTTTTAAPTSPHTGPVSPCLSQPCHNGGRCAEINSSPYFVCTCPAYYTGPTCQTFVCAGLASPAEAEVGRSLAYRLPPSGLSQGLQRCQVILSKTNGARQAFRLGANLTAAQVGSDGGVVVAEVLVSTDPPQWQKFYDSTTSLQHPVSNVVATSLNQIRITVAGQASVTLSYEAYVANPCGNDVCQNGGTCLSNGGYSPVCTCAPCFYGTLCQHARTNPCTEMPFSVPGYCGHGNCTFDASTCNAPRCSCNTGYCGTFCQNASCP